MPSITITLSAQAHARLKKRMVRGETLSEMILRELPEPCDTGAQILKSLERDYAPRPRKRRAA